MKQSSNQAFNGIFRRYSFIAVFVALFVLTGSTFLVVNQSQKLNTQSRAAGGEGLTIVGDEFYLNGVPFDMWGVRVGSASQDQQSTNELIENLDDYKAHKINTITVFYMGTSGGNYDPFTPDGRGWRDNGHKDRMNQIIEAANSHGMVVIVGIFYQNVGDKSLRDWTASQEAVRTVTRELKSKGYRNIMINIANEQSSNGYKDDPWVNVRDPEKIIELAGIVHEVDPERLVGGGGFTTTNNQIIGRSPEIDALLFDTVGTQNSESLYYKHIEAGVTNKPIVNVEQFGAWTKTSQQGVMSDADKQEFYKEVDRAIKVRGLYTFLHYNSWFQGGAQGWKNRFDLGGYGTSSDPGVRWYYEYVRDHVPSNTSNPTPSNGVPSPTPQIGGQDPTATPTLAIEPTIVPTSTTIPTRIPTNIPTAIPSPTPSSSQVPGFSVNSFVLINADSDQPIRTLTDGETINLSDIKTKNINIDALTTGVIGSVRFYVNGTQFRIENSAPYALNGNSGKNFAAWNPQDGQYTVVAIPYSDRNGRGTQGNAKQITFTIVSGAQANSGNAANTPTPIQNNNPLPNTPVSQGNGLIGYYYDNTGYTGYVGARTDNTVDFMWQKGSPFPAVSSDTFTIRWTGFVQPEATGSYTFYVNSDDGARLWVNNTNLVDKWRNHSMREYSGSVELKAGIKYPIRLDYYEDSGNAGVQMKWRGPSGTKEVIPQQNLFTDN